MNRLLMSSLQEWAIRPSRKPLVLNGARQVGKTWLLKELGRASFDNVAYVNFDGNEVMKDLFSHGYQGPDLDRIIQAISLRSGTPVVEGSTLVILDEIQECPPAITSLKYFREEHPRLAIAAAGSLLGLSQHHGTGWPVGKVETLDLHPLSFREFLDALGKRDLRETLDRGEWDLLGAFHGEMEQLLRTYCVVGGMPEAVASFADDGDFDRVRVIQRSLLDGYGRDMSKHLDPIDAERTLAAWSSIPAHLGQENKKFVFGHIREGARARDYRTGITWLIEAGIASKVPRVSKPGIPLASYGEDNIFKLFLHDVGLMGAMAGVDPIVITEKNEIFQEFKGGLTENYVCQQLISDVGKRPFYWTNSNSTNEIDFLVEDGGSVCAVEVKAGTNVRSRSLRAFVDLHPGIRARRFSLRGYEDQGWLVNAPLWAVGSPALWIR